MSMDAHTRAWEILQDAYQAQMEGDYDRAIELYRFSLEMHPPAEAHTFLGWTYHFQGRVDEERCAPRRWGAFRGKSGKARWRDRNRLPSAPGRRLAGFPRRACGRPCS